MLDWFISASYYTCIKRALSPNMMYSSFKYYSKLKVNTFLVKSYFTVKNIEMLCKPFIKQLDWDRQGQTG